MYDHAPVGSVAFRCEVDDLFVSAKALHAEAELAPALLMLPLLETAEWYEGLAFDLISIRELPEVEPCAS